MGPKCYRTVLINLSNTCMEQPQKFPCLHLAPKGKEYKSSAFVQAALAESIRGNNPKSAK